MGKSKVYAVRKGRETGIFKTWAECQKSISGFSGAEYKSFTSIEEAKRFLDNGVKDIEYKTIEELDSDEMIAYVDGSYDKNEKWYSYGVITFFNGNRKDFSDKSNDLRLVDMRNVAGELEGAKKAMRYALEMNAKRLYLHYDYEGIEKWANLSWKANKEGTKEYQSFCNEISKDLEVIFIKVKAHSGDKYNEEVDQLAKDVLFKKEKKQFMEQKIRKNDIESSKMNSSSISPVFNIPIANGEYINTKNITKEFKLKWKKMRKNIKDIEDLKIVLDIKDSDNLRAVFIVETIEGKEEVIINL
ncbi:viroplasmin family protein [Abyssisolibacter fermentans]|uniref:ribonuclease H1 domain-containing protein n=1 Tax=Abyssisolibacter fermentans TaxID=1766203 RepID=UPI0009EB4DA9